ncbi:MAG: COG4223 family protein [Rubricella sp.]
MSDPSTPGEKTDTDTDRAPLAVLGVAQGRGGAVAAGTAILSARETRDAAGDVTPAAYDDDTTAAEGVADNPEVERLEMHSEEPGASIPEPDHSDPGQDLDPESDEEEHGSLAGRVLMMLVVFILGGVAFIWAAPRVAPMLPAGMAPVAEWLQPATGVAEEEVAALAERVEARFDALEPGLPAAEVDARIDDAIGRIGEAFGGQVADLSDRLEATDSADIEERLARIETQIEGLSAEMTVLRRDLTGLADSTADLPEETDARMTAFTAQVEGLQAEVESLAGRAGELSQRIDEVAATARRQIAEAQAIAEEAEAAAAEQVADATEMAGLNALRAALASGAPYEDLLAPLAENGAVPAALSAPAATGIATQAELEQRFAAIAHDAIRAEILATAGDGAFARARAEVRARTVGRSLVPIEGDDADAVLSRMEAALGDGDLDSVLAISEQLSPASADVLSAWLDAVAQRAAALGAFESISARSGG